MSAEVASPDAGQSDDRRAATIRQADPRDLDDIARLAVQLYEQDEIPLDPARYRTALGELLGGPTLGCVWVGEIDGRTAGYLVLCFGYSLEFGGRDAFIDELVVDAPSRGRGLGTALLAQALAACPALGVNALHLEVDYVNERAKALYRRLGFADHARHLMTRWLVDASGGAPP